MKKCKIELAPMEGITTFIYRNAINKYYGGIDTYFSPFISAHKNKELNYKEKKDILPENNKGLTLVPQVMASNIDDFINTASQIKEYGYKHINLNFGCPSATVTSKGKGSGILIYPEKLERFLDEVFEKTDLKISIKTRVGYSEYEEWKRLVKIYLNYPLEELIIHPRIREDFYNGSAKREIVKETLKEYSDRLLISYNGDISSHEDIDTIMNEMPDIYACMIGRGIITKPFLSEEIADGSRLFDIEIFKAFNLEIMNNYSKEMSGDRNTLFKLKELWVYMSKEFSEDKKLLKKIQKTTSLKEYEVIIKSLRK